MEPSQIYSMCLGGIVVFLLVFRGCHALSACLQRPVHLAVDAFLFPRPRGQLWFFQPKNWSRFTLLMLYIIGTIVSNTIYVTNISEAGARAGRICLMNLIPLLVCSHELASSLLGISLDLYHSIHRALGAMTLIQGTVHVSIALALAPVNFHDVSTVYGVAATTLLAAVMLTPIFKRHLYEIFLQAHTICAMGLVFVVWKHVIHISTSSIWYVVGIASMYTITAAVQILRIVIRNITLTAHSECMIKCQGNDLEVIIYPARPWTVQAGQRVNLSIPSAGFLSLFQTHPFTIAWWETDKAGESITLLIRPRSGFTRKLQTLQRSRHLALIDGPFGSVGGARMRDYGHVFMVATGIGIAAQLPHIKDLLEGYRRGAVKTQRITLIWQLDAAEDYQAVSNWLQDLIIQDRGYVSPNRGMLVEEANLEKRLQIHFFDPTRLSQEDPQHIGEHGLIKIWGGEAQWESKLLAELQNQIGTMLIAVSARSQVRDLFRRLSLEHKNSWVELLELEFQPWERTRSIWSYF